jgi:3-dehydroquinate synthase
VSTPTHFQLDVALEQRSRIVIATGALRELGTLAGDELEGRQVVVVSDSNVDGLYGDKVREQLTSIARSVESVALPAGEPTKSVDQLTGLWEQFARWRLHRDAVIVALGGGVIGDLTGMAAAGYARGLAWIGLPTSLMAQVDSSIGGKVGVNLPAAKNLIGAFWQPRRVIIDPEVLATLGQREYRAGLAEVVKYCVIEGPDGFRRLQELLPGILQRQPAALTEIIRTSVQCKASIVLADPWEKGDRRVVLNFGHTFAHALEALAGYGQWTHGEAVSIGMVCAARLAQRTLGASPEFVDQLRGCLESLGLPTRLPPVSVDAMMQIMALDKKNRDGRLRLVLARDFGEVALVDDIPPADVREILLASDT